MGKAPADQFYWQDWARDLEEHPLKIEGAWIRICCKLWWSETRGVMTKSPIQWGRILRVSKSMALGILKYIKKEKIGDVTFCNPNVTVACRRMVRDEKARKANRDKVARHRRKEKPSYNPKSNQDVTPPSSSSPSPSKKEGDKVPPCPHQEIVNLYHKILPELPKIREWTEERQKTLKARWKENEKRQNLKWWKGFFKHIRKSDFLMGENDRGWQPNLEWLVIKSNFINVIEGKYHK